MLAPASPSVASRRSVPEHERAFAPHQAPRWFHAREPRAVAVLVHGLNMQPASLDSFAAELAAGGLSTYRAALDGHGAPYRRFARTDPAWWLDDTLAALGEASRVARRAGVPLVAVGYSLGCVVLAHALAYADPREAPASCVYYAPAFAPHRGFEVAGRVLGRTGLRMHSVLPSDLRAHRWLPFSVHRSLFRSLDSLHRVAFAGSHVPTRVWVDARDELVNVTRLRSLVARYGLPWVVEEHASPRAPRHRLLDGVYAGTPFGEELRAFALGSLA
jgi:alpha-beta hydrolase superfamily lysophospholipase